MSSAQTSDENAGELAGDEYSDTAALAKLEAACAKGNCKESSLDGEDGLNDTAIVIIASVSAVCGSLSSLLTSLIPSEYFARYPGIPVVDRHSEKSALSWLPCPMS